MLNFKTKALLLGTLLLTPGCGSEDSGGTGGSPSPAPDPADTQGNPDPGDPGDSGSGGDGQDPEDNPSSDKGEDLLDCSQLKATGMEVGQVPENLTLLAANGDMVSLHDYCNEVLFIMTGTAGWDSWGSHDFYAAGRAAHQGQAKHSTSNTSFFWDWDDETTVRAADMLKSHPDGDVRVFFLLHTNTEGKPATEALHAQQWDEFAKWIPNGQTLVDGQRDGNKRYFGGVRSSNIVLQRGFKVFKRDSENYKADIALALNAK